MITTSHNAITNEGHNVMTTTASLLERFNELRVANDMKPIAKWKASRAKLEEAIEELTPQEAATTRTGEVADYARLKGVHPKVARQKLRRHLDKAENCDKSGRWILTEAVKAVIDGE
jgi:hypothetical protein